MNQKVRQICRVSAAVLLSVLLMVVLASCGSSKTKSQSETVGNWQWSWDKSTKTLTISGNGAMTEFGGASEAAWYSFRDEIESLVVTDGVTSVGSYACYSMPSLKTVSLGTTVTVLGDFSFAYCNALTSVAFPSALQQVGDSAFEGCSALETVSLPSAVNRVGERAFAYCYSLNNVVVSGAEAVIEEYAFQNCRSLSSALFHSAIGEERIAESAFSGAALQISEIHRSDSPVGATVLTVRYLLNGEETEKKEYFYDYGAEYTVVPPEREGYTADTETITGVADGQPRQVTVRYVPTAVEEAELEISSVAKAALVIMVLALVGIGVAVVILIRADGGKKEKEKIRRNNYEK